MNPTPQTQHLSMLPSVITPLAKSLHRLRSEYKICFGDAGFKPLILLIREGSDLPSGEKSVFLASLNIAFDLLPLNEAYVCLDTVVHDCGGLSATRHLAAGVLS